jgi:hypothetical protein
MQTVDSTFVHFSGLQDQVPVIRRSGESWLEAGELDAGVLTRLVYRRTAVATPAELDLARQTGRVLRQSHGWSPEFWWDPQLVRTTVELMTAVVPRPVIWLMGDYDTDEVRKFVDAGDLPDNFDRALPSQLAESRARRQLVPLIIRREWPGDVPLPSQQGYGHMRGVRIAVFDVAREPSDVYGDWLRASAIGAARGFDAVLRSDTNALAPAMAWLAPYAPFSRFGKLTCLAAESAGIDARISP